MKIIIVGGVAGGATAAARIRRLDEEAEIRVYERSGFISYANCGLPYYIGEVITDKEELTLQSPENFRQRFNVEMLVNHEVIGIDPDNKSVAVRNLLTGEEITDHYDKLLLAPGAQPIKLNIPGSDHRNIFSLRTVEDSFRIYEHIKQTNAGSAAIIGGGFIGLEVAENLRNKGIEVTVLEKADQLMTPLDWEMAAFVHAELRKHGVKLIFKSEVTEFRDSSGQVELILDSGRSITADFVLQAIGVTADNDLAKKLDLPLGLGGTIVVNDRMETAVKDIYAVGDAVQIKNHITSQPARIPLAGPANKQARIAADNICGLESHYEGAQATSILRLFDCTVATTGINEKMARSLNLNYDKVYLSPNNHAAYYPGASIINMKILYDRDSGNILGGQMIGADGVDKRIDVLATAMYAGLKANQLKELDLAYAPPFSSAKDPVNMAGFMIENIQKGILKQWFWHDVDELPRDGSVGLLDVRTDGEFNKGHFEGFRHIPVDELRARVGELDSSKPLYVNCQSGVRSYIACRILQQLGFDCYNLSGGYRLYEIIKTEVNNCRSSSVCGMDK